MSPRPHLPGKMAGKIGPPPYVKIDPLHGDVTFGYFRIRPFDSGGQKCITVIERKALIVSLFTNASDYSSETTIFVRYKHIDLSMQVLLE